MVKPPLRTKSIGFKVSEEEYAQLEMAAQTSGRSLGEWCREVLLASAQETKPTAPAGAEAQALMAELVALRAILLNVLFKLEKRGWHFATELKQRMKWLKKRQSAADKGSDEKKQLNKVLKFLGKPGQANYVSVKAGSLSAGELRKADTSTTSDLLGKMHTILLSTSHHCYAFRRTVATRMLRSGESAKLVSDILGNSVEIVLEDYDLTEVENFRAPLVQVAESLLPKVTHLASAAWPRVDSKKDGADERT